MKQYSYLPSHRFHRQRGLKNSIQCALLIMVAVATSVAGQELPVVINTNAGSQVQGTLNSIEFETINVQTADGFEKIGFEQIETVEFGVDVARPIDSVVLARLVDGSVLQCKTVEIGSGKFRTELHCGTVLEFDSRNVSWIRFRSYENQLEFAKQWREILDDASREGDAIVVNRSSELEAVEGIVGDLQDDKLSFSIDDRTARVSVSKLDAILFYHAAGRVVGSPVCEIVLTDSTSILTRKIDWDRSKIKVTSVCGSTLEVDVDDVSALNFRLSRDVWLSKMQPTTNDWKPLITSSAIFEQLRKMKLARVDQSFSGMPLDLNFHSQTGISFLADTRQFENGFAIQGGGKLAFSLEEKYKKLTGLVGFDPAANSSGNVLFKVLLDGKILIEKELVHRDMKNPLELDLDVRDGNRIVFQVEYHDGRSTGDQLHLVDLKVSQ
jgi:hypothetical protein